MEEKDTAQESKTGGLIFEYSESPDYDKTIKVFEEGDVVSGSVVRIDRDEILIDVGYKSEGVIPIKELDVRGNIRPEDVVSLGEQIDALVLQKEDKEGRLILSRKRAEYEKAWIRLAKTFETSELIEGEVIEVVKGGLIVNIGLRGFLPASLVDLRRVKDLNQYLGQKIFCRIIEMDRNRNNVVLSRRDALEDEQHDKRVHVLKRLKPGEFVEGTVSSIVTFGAFVDLGGIDGLIHISEMSWDHVNDPHDIVEVGQQIKVKVLDINFEKERVSLGLKQTQPDPWREKVDKFPKGSICKGEIVKVVPFGVFVRLTEEVEGLVHVSEISYQHIENPASVYSEGDKVDVKVMDIDYDKHRIKLSIKATQPVPAPAPEEEKAPVAETEEEKPPIVMPDEETSSEVMADVREETPEPKMEVELEPSTEAELEPSTVAELEPSIEPELESASETELPAPVEEAADEPAMSEPEEVEQTAEPEIAEPAEPEIAEVEPEGAETAEADEEAGPDEAEEEEYELKESAEFDDDAKPEVGGAVSLESVLEDMKREAGKD